MTKSKSFAGLHAYNQIVHQLATLCDNPPNLNLFTEEELTDSLLQLDELFITYDTQQRKITDVSL